MEWLLEMMQKERSIQKECGTSRQIVVHCSAGIGRTGTIIALFFLTQHMQIYRKNYESDLPPKQKKKYRLSIFGMVRRLREQRWGMV